MVFVRKKISLLTWGLAWLPALWIGCEGDRSGSAKPGAGTQVWTQGISDLDGQEVDPFAASEASGNVYLLYHGWIDDRFVDFGTERPAATRHELEEVLEAVAADEPVVTASAPGVGCSIADLRRNTEP
jgi:hypothetical protein